MESIKIRRAIQSCIWVFTVSMVVIFPSASYGTLDFPDAMESDPAALGWMQGFPPPPDKRIMQPESDYFSFPKLRWTVCHIRELLPTKQVSRGIGPPVPLKYAIDRGIDTVHFTPLGGGEPMTWRESLSSNYTDGMLFLHKDRVV